MQKEEMQIADKTEWGGGEGGQGEYTIHYTVHSAIFKGAIHRDGKRK